MGFTGSVTATDRDNVRVLTVPRELDVYDAPEMRQAGTDAVADGHYRLVIDMTGLEYIDSTGLGVLVGMLKRTQAHGGWVRLACMSPAAARTFRKTGLHKVFVIADTVEGAINYDIEGAETA